MASRNSFNPSPLTSAISPSSSSSSAAAAVAAASVSAPMSASIELVTDFKDRTLDDEPIFPADWDQQDESPYDGNLYSTPFCWDPPEPKIDYQPPPNIMTLNSLTAAQHQKLRNIAMPSHLQYNGHPSPHSTDSSKSHSISSPDNNDRSRKRKSSAEVDDDDDEDSNPPVKKTAHNMIEKRYRTNLNDKIAALRDSVPSLRIMTKSARGEDTMDDREDLQGLTPAHKLNKATVLSKATEYIGHLEKLNKRLQQENAEQKARLSAFETLFRSGNMGFNPSPPINNPFQYAPDYVTPGTSPSLDPQGMIQVPGDIRRLQDQTNQQMYQVPQDIYQARQQQQQEHLQQQQQQQQRQHQHQQQPQQPQPPMGPAGWGNPYLGKFMVGSFAGLMIMEGFSEAENSTESSASRGLFALPTGLLRYISSTFYSAMDVSILGYHVSATESLWYLKLVLILGALVYAFLASLLNASPKPSCDKNQNTSLAAAPSLASSIQVRRQAWLTAVQTVWVPRHNFFLEAAALCLKMMKLSMRNVIGSQGYAYLTGITEQQEAARIKAWTIALDAQLAGGDVEVSKSRLTLTLLASETLPDTPARLMLKALHLRVLLWEVGNAGFNGFYLFHEFAAKLARWKWNEAKQLHQLTAHVKDEQEKLPEYLVALLEQECDHVLVDSVGQRAYNLAWNLPTTSNTCGNTDCMDGVVDDFAIRSPLDAVAAWFSSLVLQRALIKSLESRADDLDAQKMIEDSLALAIRTAPTGSGPQLRALVARAVLVKEKRGTNIAEAMQALGPIDKQIGKRESTLNIINTNTSMASLPEVRLSLRCAMAIAHIERFPAPANPEKAHQIIRTILPRHLTLLGFAATFQLMEKINSHDLIAASCVNTLEKLAGGLRIWIGGKQGEKSGLDKELKRGMVERCLGITKRIVGMEDAGYGSMTEEDLGESC